MLKTNSEKIWNFQISDSMFSKGNICFPKEKMENTKNAKYKRISNGKRINRKGQKRKKTSKTHKNIKYNITTHFNHQTNIRKHIKIINKSAFWRPGSNFCDFGRLFEESDF